MSATPGAAGPDQQQFYDEMWQSYGHLDAVSPAAFHRRRIVVELAVKHAPGARTILDVGCGQGELLRELAAALPRAKISGADLSRQSIADSRVRNPTFELFEMDVTRPDFDTAHADRVGKFDLIVCSEVLEHIPDHRLAAERLNSLLTPGGTAIITVPGGKMSGFDKVIGHQRHYTTSSLDALLRSAGLRVERVLAWGFPFHNFYRTAVRIMSKVTIDPEAKPKEKKEKSAVSSVLGVAYTAFGKALKPLFYLNANVLGEQLLAVGRKG